MAQQKLPRTNLQILGLSQELRIVGSYGFDILRRKLLMFFFSLIYKFLQLKGM